MPATKSVFVADPAPINDKRFSPMLFIPLSGVTANSFDAVGSHVVVATALVADFVTATSLHGQHLCVNITIMAPGTHTITVSGTAIGENTGMPVAGAAEVLTVDALGRFQTSKKWLLITAVQVSGGALPIEYALEELGYIDFGNRDVILHGFRCDFVTTAGATVPDCAIRIRTVKTPIEGSSVTEILVCENIGFDTTAGGGDYTDFVRTGVADRSLVMPVHLGSAGATIAMKATDFCAQWGDNRNIIHGTSRNEGFIIGFHGVPAGGLTTIDHVCLTLFLEYLQ